MKLYKVKQNLVSRPLENIEEEVYRQMDALELNVPQGEVAITSGSRGIDHIALITRSVGRWLKKQGAKPFLVPCMGSHNGATAEGQQSMIESLGITEEAMEMEIRSSMDVVELGRVSSGKVYMDQFCHQCEGVVVLNRIKLHTAFSGPVQSGLMKMMVVGMGKIKSAKTFHSTPVDQMKDMLLEMGHLILDSGKILAGVGILEDGFDQTTKIKAILPKDIARVEPELVEEHRQLFPRLPIDNLNVLLVNKIGKTYSGTGMDTNVIGHRGIKGYEDLKNPTIKIIAALELDPKSQGNAIGVGLADFITKKLRDAIDEEKTFINVFSTGEMGRMKIPATMKNDSQLFSKIHERFGGQGWMFIPNTLHLGTLYISEDLKEKLPPSCHIVDEMEFALDKSIDQLDFK